MRRNSFIVISGAVGACVALSGCNVLGPRYEVRKQAIELRYPAAAADVATAAANNTAPPPAVAHAEVSYELRNTGTVELNKLTVEMPPNLNASAAALITPEMALRDLPLGTTWKPKKTHKTQIEYSFVVPRAGDAALFLADRDWLPQLQPPEGIMAGGGSAPEKLKMYVTLPADFRIAAPGRYHGADSRDGMRRHEFEVTADDLPPYIVAGRFEEQVVDRNGVRLHFWTTRPLAHAEAERVAGELSAAVQKYVAQLGALPDKRTHLFLVDSRDETATDETFVFGGGIVFDPPLFISSGTGDAAICRASRWLAGVWFEAVTKPRDDARDLAEALALSLSGSALPRCAAQEIPATAGSMEREKARLFVAALEQKIGTKPLHAALRRMVYALAGGEWGLTELRAAVESETTQNLADFFRVWNEPGIPQQLRTQKSELRE